MGYRSNRGAFNCSDFLVEKMRTVQAISKIKIIVYGIKQFIKYFLYGFLASNIPFIFIGPILGFPAVIYAAVFLAIYEVIHIDLKKDWEVEVFSEATIAFLILTLVIIILYYIILLHFLK